MLIPLFRLLTRGKAARFRADLLDPAAAQSRRLQAILRANQGCHFGRRHGFAALRSFEDYRRAVPIRPYEGFADEIDRMRAGAAGVLTSQPVAMFATTSGTSARPKFCPVTRAFTLEHHAQHLLWMRHLLADRPPDLIRALFSVISPAEVGRTAGGIPYGAASGRQFLNQAWPLRRLHPVPYAVAGIADYEARRYCLLRFALAAELSAVTSVNPSTLVQLAQTLRDRAEPLLDDLAAGRLAHAGALTEAERAALAPRLRPRPERAAWLRERLRTDGALLPRTAWPTLRSINTWQGGSAPFYLRRLPALWGEAPQRCLGLRASEGTFSIPLADHTPEGVLAVGGHVMEFLPEGVEPSPHAPTLLAHELEVGRRYRLLITTSGGFYRYDLADIVEVTGRHHATPMIAFLHKAGGVLSITGEKVTENQVVAVMAGLGPKTGPTTGPEAMAAGVQGFTVTQELVDPPRYLLAVESQAPAAELRALLHAFDAALAEANEEYAGKRASGRLAPPDLLRLAEGAYQAHRAALVAEGRPDGQIKPPHLIPPAGPGPAPVGGCPFFDRATIQQRLAWDAPNP